MKIDNTTLNTKTNKTSLLTNKNFSFAILDQKNEFKNINSSQASKTFEGLILYMLLKIMKNSFPKNKEWINNNQESLYQDIYNQFLSQKISQKGLGLSSFIENQINKIEKNSMETLKVNKSTYTNQKKNDILDHNSPNIDIIKYINISQTLLPK